jgi:hypothetical protein
MVGKLRAQLGRVIGAEGWVVCSLLLASTLLTGCGGTSASSTANSAANGVASQSIFGSTLARTALTSASTGSTGSAPSSATSPPASTDKSVDVTWTAPTTNTNGSALVGLAGYTIYYGNSPSSLNRSINVANAGATDYVVQGLPSGTWYFAVTAYTNTGLQSSDSTVVSKTIT